MCQSARCQLAQRGIGRTARCPSPNGDRQTGGRQAVEALAGGGRPETVEDLDLARSGRLCLDGRPGVTEDGRSGRPATRDTLRIVPVMVPVDPSPTARPDRLVAGLRPAGPEADDDGMGWWKSRDVETTDMHGMTAEDREDFARLNKAVAAAAKATSAVIEGGRALKVIRDRQLFRGVAETWDSYLALHGLTRRRGDQLVAAAGVLDAVSERVQAETGTVVPELSERAIRPLAGLDTEDAVQAVLEAAGTEDGITPATIRKAAGKRRKTKAAKGPSPRRWRVPGWVIVATPNRKAGPVTDALAEALRQAGQTETGTEAA
jgi:hypothetical protein